MTTSSEDAELRAESAQIEQLLAELRELVVPAAWQRIEHVLHRVVGMYGAGLARAFSHARAAGASSAALDALVVEDELLASLLLLHGLHPISMDERVRRTVDRLRVELQLAAGELELDRVEAGEVRLRVTGSLGGGAMAERVAERVIRRALEAAAPELVSIEIVGTRSIARDSELVQLRTRPSPR